MSHLHVLAHSNIKHLDLSMCSSLITDQLITAVGFRCKVRKYGIHENKACTVVQYRSNSEIIKFLSGFCDIRHPRVLLQASLPCFRFPSIYVMLYHPFASITVVVIGVRAGGARQLRIFRAKRS